MNWWPGWNSAESANWWSNVYFWVGIASLILLGASEVVSHVYGLRKDELVGIAERTRAAAARDANTQAEDRRKADVAAVQKQLVDAETRAKAAEKQANEVRAYQTFRKLNETQKASIIEACKPFAGQVFEAESIAGNDDSQSLRDSLIKALEEAGWKTDPSKISSAFFVQNPIGLQILINNNEVDAAFGNIPKSVETFILALLNNGVISSQHVLTLEPSVPAGEIKLVVGAKPPLP